MAAKETAFSHDNADTLTTPFFENEFEIIVNSVHFN